MAKKIKISPNPIFCYDHSKSLRVWARKKSSSFDTDTRNQKCTTSFLHKSKPPQKDIDAERILAEVEAMFEEEKKRLKEFLAEDEAILKEYVVCDISVCPKLNSKISKTRKTNSRTKINENYKDT